MASGISVIETIEFASCVTGGKRKYSIGEAWESGDGESYLCVVHVYAYQDEWTEDVNTAAIERLEALSVERGIPYRFSAPDLFNIEACRASIERRVAKNGASASTAAWMVLGCDALADRL